MRGVTLGLAVLPGIVIYGAVWYFTGWLGLVAFMAALGLAFYAVVRSAETEG